MANYGRDYDILMCRTRGTVGRAVSRLLSLTKGDTVYAYRDAVARRRTVRAFRAAMVVGL